MTIRIGAQEARRRFSEILGRVRDQGDTIIVENLGEPMAVVLPLELYERLMSQRQARFGVLDRVREGLPDLPAEEVEHDVAEALADVRRDAAAGS